MLKRYSKEKMRVLWSEENKFAAMLEVEILAACAWGELGEIPKKDIMKIKKNASFSIPRILEIEQETKHDVVAFTRAVSETLGDEKKWIHYGLTSTDVVDTAYGYIYKQANDIINEDILHLIEVLKNQALKYKDTIIMGRTHGIHAEVTTFGLKFALWYEEMNRNLERFNLARKQIEVGKISGAVGTFANTPPFVEEYVCQNLGIDFANVSTQTLQRDRHAFYLSTIALIGTSLEKMATEIRHLQRSEVNEVQEYFSKNQKGSSAMPHKKNPIGSENIVGCARVLRGYMLTGFENVSLWHERDISHSSAERIIMPDATMLLDYMLSRFTNILENLFVNEDNMLKNIDKTMGLIFSQRVLLLLIDKGLSRELAYDTVQPLTLKAWDLQIHFRELVKKEKKIMDLINEDELNECFNPKYHLKNVHLIYERLNLK